MEMRASCIPVKRSSLSKEGQEHEYNSNEIFLLFREYELDKFEIGPIVFNADILNEPSYWVIGYDETPEYRLCIDKVSGEIVVVNPIPGRSPMFVAVGDRAFLDAFSHLACFLALRASREELYNDIEANRREVEACVALAGGLKYKNFFDYVLS